MYQISTFLPAVLCLSVLPAERAAGYYNPGRVLATCEVCPNGSWCPGVGALDCGVAIKNACAAGLTTVTTGATSAASCVTLAGYGYNTATSPALACPVGTYSAGAKKESCTACPAGLTTSGPQTSTVDKCAAPEGFYYVTAVSHACVHGSEMYCAGLCWSGSLSCTLCLHQHGSACLSCTTPAVLMSPGWPCCCLSCLCCSCCRLAKPCPAPRERTKGA